MSYITKPKYQHGHKDKKVMTKKGTKGVVFKISVILCHVQIAWAFLKREIQSWREVRAFRSSNDDESWNETSCKVEACYEDLK